MDTFPHPRTSTRQELREHTVTGQFRVAQEAIWKGEWRTNMLPAEPCSVSIACNWQALYERIWRPEFFPKWASALSESDL